MNWQHVYKAFGTDYLKLLLIMGMAVYIAFIPHHNYPYLVHLDEWTHMACSNQIIGQAGISGLLSPFSGGPPFHNQLFEVGFHVFWAVFHQISGISWLDIFRYFPSVIFLLTVLSVYILSRRQGFGWEAALFTCLVPTTTGILGPGFLVPVALGLPFIALSLFLVINFRTWWSYLLVFVFLGLLLTIHSVTALILVIILFPLILLNLRGDLKHSIKLSLVVVAPLLIVFLWMLDVTLPVAKLLFGFNVPSPYVLVPSIIPTYGYLPSSIAILGVFLLSLRGGGKNYSLVFSLISVLLMLAAFYSFHFGITFVYYRGLMVMLLMMSIVAGAGMMELRQLQLPAKVNAWVKAPVITRNAGNILCLIIIVLTFVVAIPFRQNIGYYHMIDSEDYQAFVWIEQNVESSYEKAVLDPWKGAAFTAITGKYVYSLIGERPTDKDNEVYAFLDNGCVDTTFLIENDISIVYTRGECRNPDLIEVREYVFLTDDAPGSKKGDASNASLIDSIE